MPSLTTPPISRGVSVMSTAGRCAPSGANATSPPGSGTFGAPHTIFWSAPPPRSTVTSRSFSRVGCGSKLFTSATTSVSVPSPNSVIASTSRPACVSRRPTSSGEASRPGTSSRSQR